jgi:hypothetical protein
VGVPWPFRKMGEYGDAATTIDMQPLQQRIGSLSLAAAARWVRSEVPRGAPAQ